MTLISGVILSCIIASSPAHAKRWDVATSFTTQNPNGVWQYGYNAQKQFKRLKETLQLPGKVIAWKRIGFDNGLLKNISQKTIVTALGVKMLPGALIVHAGKRNHPKTTVRFTAPKSQRYTFTVEWQHLGMKGNKMLYGVVTNASHARDHRRISSPNTTKVLHRAVLSRTDKKTRWHATMRLKAGETIDAYVENGKDGNRYDYARLRWWVTTSPTSRPTTRKTRHAQ